ncbi:MAG: TonB-dependent receptor [Tannerellaceae bacterium]|nr:TonB-dependent receptor [Tannerellaceae bacterium]
MKFILSSFLVMIGCFQLLAQPGGVTMGGTVYDHFGETLPGANVYIKDQQSVGTTTDLDGNFQIRGNVGDVIVFAFVGYDPVEYPVTKEEKNIVIRFRESSLLLDDVVVVGYSVQKKSVMSSAVSRVTGEDLDMGNPTNVQNALKGKVSGVQITSNSGQPGDDSKIRIRGTGTVNNSNPLYIIDGMPNSEGINHLNPSDIESIEILKDAASAAIYGARGANGVVLVTTKKGTQGAKATLNYEFTYGFQNPARNVKLLDSQNYQMLMNEMAANSGKDPYFPTPSSVNTDWQKELTNRNAPVTNHKLSISGGSENSTYFLSFGYLNQSGIFAKGYSDYERYNARLNHSTILMDAKDRNWLNKVTFGSIISYTHSKFTGGEIDNNEASGLIASMNMLPPTETIYQDNASVLEQYALSYPNYIKDKNGRAYNIIDMNEINNPFAAMQVRNNTRKIPQVFSGNFNLDVDVLPGLKFKTTAGMDWTFTSDKRVTPEYDLNTTNKNTLSSIVDEKIEARFWQWENIVTYTKSFGVHNLTLLGGTTMSSYHLSNLKGTDYDLLVADIDKGYIDIAAGDRTLERVEGKAEDHRLASVFGRVNYNYDEKYLFEAVVRRDGSSNFGTNHKYAVFPSVSAGWVLSREGFMDNRPGWIDFIKLRASWGQNGNENIGAFGYTSMMSMGNNAVVDGQVLTGAKTSGYVNSDLKWETSEQTDIGIDLRFLGNALTFTADYFHKKTKDMLLEVALPEYTGFKTMKVNKGSVKNEGVELEASYRFKIDQVNLRVGANASYVKNTVTDIGDERIGIDILGGGLGGTVTWMETGKPYGFFYGYVHDGIFQNQAEVDAHVTADGTPKQPNARPGDVRYKDLDGKDGITGEDRTMIGDPNPDWTYGFTLSAEWKGFDLYAFFQGVHGNDVYRFYRRANITYANWDETWLNRWHGEGTSNWMPRVVEGDPNNNTTWVSNLFVEDGSYLRLKVLQLGYQLPSHILRKAFIKNLRLFAQGENLFTITNYTGIDPEVGTRNGFDGGTHPQARTFTFGANITF